MPLVLALVSLSWGLEPQAQDLPTPPPYNVLRYDEDYRYLKDPERRTEVLDSVKYVPLDAEGAASLSFGGDIRERYEYFHNPGWGAGEEESRVFQRYMLHGDLRLGDSFRVFAQLKSCLESGDAPRPIDQDRLDLHQAFADAILPLAPEGSLTIRLGRQELQYGSARLVSAREGPNVRQSFDGAKVILLGSGWRMDAFLTRPVETDPGVFDDGSDRTREFWGLYAAAPPGCLLGGSAEVYYLGLDRENAQFDQGTAHESRHTVGSRYFGREGALDYNCEAVYQFGHFGAGEIRAWGVASDTGWVLDALPWKPRIGLKADVSSGDHNPSSQKLGTLNPLFPRGNYFSEAGLLGPVNFIDVDPSLTFQPTPQVTFSVNWDFFWRQSTRDGIYGNGLNLVKTGQTSDERSVGSQLTFMADWRLQRHLTLSVAYTHFYAGAFLKETSPGKDMDFVGVTLAFRY
jgi:hypothetical protein